MDVSSVSLWSCQMKIALYLDEFELIVVHFRYDFGLSVLAEVGKLAREIDCFVGHRDPPFAQTVSDSPPQEAS
jgi:hypothetical protein